jgi:uncharacterized membrane protein YgcG
VVVALAGAVVVPAVMMVAVRIGVALAVAAISAAAAQVIAGNLNLNDLWRLFKMMKNAKRFLQITAMILLVASTGFAQIQIPQPQGLVNDFADKLNPATKQTLENQLRDFNAQHGIEVAVVTIPFDRLQNNSIENYTHELARIWRNNSGHPNLQMVLLVAIKNVKAGGKYHGSTRLEVSRNLEQVLPDKLAGEIIRGMREDLKAGRFDDALMKGVKNTLSALSQSYGVLPDASGKQGNNPNSKSSVLPTPLNQTSGAQNSLSRQNLNPTKGSWVVPVILVLTVGLPLLIVAVIVFFIIRSIGKSNGIAQGSRSNYQSDQMSSEHIYANQHYVNHAPGWNDSNNYSSHDNSSSSSYSDSSTYTGSGDSSSSSYSDSSSYSSYSDSSSSSFSDTSSSSSDSSSSSSSGGSTDSW